MNHDTRTFQRNIYVQLAMLNTGTINIKITMGKKNMRVRVVKMCFI